MTRATYAVNYKPNDACSIINCICLYQVSDQFNLQTCDDMWQVTTANIDYEERFNADLRGPLLGPYDTWTRTKPPWGLGPYEAIAILPLRFYHHGYYWIPWTFVDLPTWTFILSTLDYVGYIGFSIGFSLISSDLFHWTIILFRYLDVLIFINGVSLIFNLDFH